MLIKYALIDLYNFCIVFDEQAWFQRFDQTKRSIWECSTPCCYWRGQYLLFCRIIAYLRYKKIFILYWA